MNVTSSAFGNGETIPVIYTCDGENISIPIDIADVPEGTDNLALIMDDPDAPNGTFTHWLLWGIDPTAPFIPEGSVPSGIFIGTSDSGTKGYTGPCPPANDEAHRYFIKIFALNMNPGLPAGSTRDAVDTAIKNSVIARAELMGMYKRLV
ncbi:MAG: YbhB/YbcL family Raf kinase inhibitor-like protein [Candidatus Dojkabacteria bacterium]|nr:YbhB/YbcL family Raf kinase inhibitor-like protein [Candidatus Dojkabacteria bacterium]